MKTFLFAYKVILCWLLCLTTLPLVAQQHHYWNMQFGARSSLLGGAVVAGNNDNSAIYYNPAALTLSSNASISLNANVYQMAWFDVKNGLGAGLDINSTEFDLYPQFVAGTIDFKNPRLKVGYALLTRDYHYLKLDERYETFTDAIPGLAGNEEFIGSFEYFNRANEQWAGLAVGYQLHPKFSIGLTQFVGYRAQTSRSTFTSEAVSTDLSRSFYVARVRQHEDIAYTNVKTLWKLGFLLDLKPLRVGLAITTPSVNINISDKSTGTSRREFSISNLNVTLPDSIYPNALATDRQEGIASTYKTPFSVALGLEYAAPSTKVSMTVEYFSEIDKYWVLRPEVRPVFRPSNVFKSLATDEFLAVANYSQSIVNVAVGVEQKLSPTWSLLAGFRTDFNTFDEEAGEEGAKSLLGEIIPDPTYWDLFHVSAGIMIKQKYSRFTAGLSYYFSVSNDDLQFTNYDNPKDFNFFEGALDNTAQTRSRALKLVIGYTHYLKPKK